MTQRLALVDLSGLFWRLWHAGKEQPLGFAFEGTIDGVRRFVEGFDYVAICCDAPPYWRKQISEAYKAQRDKPEQQAIAQLRRVEARLEADGYCIWKIPGYEADDVIATAARIATSEAIEVVIGSSDKDLLQLVSDELGVSAVSVVQGVSYNEAAVSAKYEVPPSLMRDMLALWGDKSDNIPGVPSIGPKTAAKLLKDFGSVNGILANCDKIDNGRIRELIFRHADALRLSLKLVTLKDDAPINFNDCKAPRIAKPLTEGESYDMVDEGTNETETPSEEAPSAPAVESEVVPPSGQHDKPEGQKSQAIEKAKNGNGKNSIVTAPAASFDMGLQPGSLGGAYTLARGLYESRMFPRLPNPEAIWAVIIRGRELGLGALTALECIDFYEGKLAFKAHYLISRAMAHPECEYFEFLGGDSTYAEYETKSRRNKNPTRLKYTIEQARKAGLIKDRSNWDKRPDEMLRKTCGVQLARIVYPSALAGAYSQEELEGAA